MNSRKNNRKSTGAIRVEKVLASSPVQEWYEFRVFRGNALLATFYTPDEALAFVTGMKSGDFTAFTGNAAKAAYAKGMLAA